MHQALYRKWRPRTFSEVCGQEHITNVLANEVANGRVNHAYLFCGSRGTGKTTCAKILAKAVNCEHPVDGNPCNECPSCLSIDSGTATDVLEMDAASNNGVDYIRDIRDEVVYSPSALKMRVYIIDEVHMLSASAFNALLKTLEEPPPQVLFILATTETQKIPSTILSRCQRFDFRRIASPVIADRLEVIAQSEQLTLDREAALKIAKLSAGGMRDSISLLELCSGSPGVIDLNRVNEVSGASGRDVLAATAAAILSGDIDSLFAIIDKINSASKDISVYFSELLAFYRDMLVVKSARNAASYLDLTAVEYEETKQLAAQYRTDQILYHCRLLDDAFTAMQKNSNQKRLSAEMTLIRMSNEKQGSSYEALASRISALEDKIALGYTAQPVVSVTAPDIKPSKSLDSSNSGESTSCISAESRPVSFWMEAVKKFDGYDPSSAPFLHKAKAMQCGDIIVITVTDKFAHSMLGKEEVLVKLTDALRTFDQSITKVQIELAPAENADLDNGVSEIISSL